MAGVRRNLLGLLSGNTHSSYPASILFFSKKEILGAATAAERSAAPQVGVLVAEVLVADRALIESYIRVLLTALVALGFHVALQPFSR
jgi:hypothetical protein